MYQYTVINVLGPVRRGEKSTASLLLRETFVFSKQADFPRDAVSEVLPPPKAEGNFADKFYLGSDGSMICVRTANEHGYVKRIKVHG